MNIGKLSQEQMSELSLLFNGTNNLMLTIMGVANNAAWMACLESLGHIRKHPKYLQHMKGGSTIRLQFMRCVKLYNDYEKKLKYGLGPRFFHVADLAPEARKSYGPDFTDDDYYKLWAASGQDVYASTLPFYTSLVNKVRLAYLNHGADHPDIMGWAVAGHYALKLSVDLWTSAIQQCVDMQKEFPYIGFYIPRKEWANTYKDFNLSTVADFWKKCVNYINPAEYELTEQENSNILAGYEQLEEKWTDDKALYGSRISAAEKYAEMFRTKGEMKKLMKHYAEMREAYEEGLKG